MRQGYRRGHALPTRLHSSLARALLSPARFQSAGETAYLTAGSIFTNSKEEHE